MKKSKHIKAKPNYDEAANQTNDKRTAENLPRANDTSNLTNGNDANFQHESNNDESEGRELASRCLLFPPKRFYLDVKQNKRGRFIKVAEVAFNGRKSRIIFSMRTAKQVCDLLYSFSKYEETEQDEPEEEQQDHEYKQDERLKSERIQQGTRLYYFDLKENNRGRYLRCSQFSTHPSTSRSQIAIPEPHLLEFRTHMLELIKDHDDTDYQDGSENSNPTTNTNNIKNNRRSKSPQTANAVNGDSSVNNTTATNNEASNNSASKDYLLESNKKKIYLGVDSNQNGSFVRITQVMGYRKSSITIPDDLFSKFSELFNKCSDEASQLDEA